MKDKRAVVLAVGIAIASLMARAIAQTDGEEKGPGRTHAPAWIVSYSGISEMEQQKSGPEVVKNFWPTRVRSLWRRTLTAASSTRRNERFR